MRESQTQAAAAISRYHDRLSGGGRFAVKFRAPPGAVVQYDVTGAAYPRFIRFPDGSNARVDSSGDVQEF